jgi:hypothetical protein
MSLSHPIPFEDRTKLRIPLVSAKVQAGFPSPADDHMEQSLDLNEHLVANPAATFFVRVQGDSMRDAGIASGDILIVDRSLHLVREQGKEPVDAILEAVRSRIRPIFMTTFTTVLGLLPLVIFPGAGSELYRGLGSVLLGGLLVSTVVTLVLVPLLLGLCLRKPLRVEPGHSRGEAASDGFSSQVLPGVGSNIQREGATPPSSELASLREA